MSRTARIELRATEAEKKAWADAAGGSRRVSEWLRSLANAATSQAPLIDEPKILTEKVGIGGNGVKLPPKDCPRAHHHRPGVYCGTCGKVN